MIKIKWVTCDYYRTNFLFSRIEGLQNYPMTLNKKALVFRSEKAKTKDFLQFIGDTIPLSWLSVSG